MVLSSWNLATCVYIYIYFQHNIYNHENIYFQKVGTPTVFPPSVGDLQVHHWQHVDAQEGAGSFSKEHLPWRGKICHPKISDIWWQDRHDSILVQAFF